MDKATDASTEAEDVALWELCRHDDADAFGVLFERHSNAVYKYAFRLTANWHEAEEVLSITFLEAWRKRHRTTLQKSSLLPWLMGIATNVNRNRARSLRRNAALLERIGGSNSVPDFAESLADRLDAEQQMRSVLQALATLTERDRTVFILCVLEGLPYERVAEIVGVPIGTVRSRLNRARRLLNYSPVAFNNKTLI